MECPLSCYNFVDNKQVICMGIARSEISPLIVIYNDIDQGVSDFSVC